MMLNIYQVSKPDGARRMIVSDWDFLRIAQWLDNQNDGFEIETFTDLENEYGCPVEIVR